MLWLRKFAIFEQLTCALHIKSFPPRRAALRAALVWLQAPAGSPPHSALSLKAAERTLCGVRWIVRFFALLLAAKSTDNPNYSVPNSLLLGLRSIQACISEPCDQSWFVWITFTAPPKPLTILTANPSLKFPWRFLRYL